MFLKSCDNTTCGSIGKCLWSDHEIKEKELRMKEKTYSHVAVISGSIDENMIKLLADKFAIMFEDSQHKRKLYAPNIQSAYYFSRYTDIEVWYERKIFVPDCYCCSNCYTPLIKKENCTLEHDAKLLCHDCYLQNQNPGTL